MRDSKDDHKQGKRTMIVGFKNRPTVGGKYDRCGPGLRYSALDEDGMWDPNSTSGNYMCTECVGGEWVNDYGHLECEGGYPRLFSTHVAEPLHLAPELSKAPPDCKDKMAWTTPISVNSPYQGFSAFQSIVRYPSLSSSFPRAVEGVEYDLARNLGRNSKAEKRWRDRLRGLARLTRKAAPKAHPATRAQIREFAARANAALIRLGKIYGGLKVGGKKVPREADRKEIRALYLRAVQLLWCAMYQRALSESYYKNKKRRKAQRQAATFVPTATATFQAADDGPQVQTSSRDRRRAKRSILVGFKARRRARDGR